MYKIIQDEQALDHFIETVLPDLKQDECFYVSLFARKKYSPEMVWSSDKSQLKRLTCTKQNLKQKLRQLEINEGCYILGDRVAPQESLVVYIHPNPRSQKQAAKLLLKKLADIISDNNTGYNVHQEALSALQKSKGQKIYVDFDFDLDSKFQIHMIRKGVLDNINEDAVTFIETRGGLHVLVKTQLIKEEYKNKWYQGIAALGADVQGDCMLPIPGCCQGGFVPKIIFSDPPSGKKIRIYSFDTEGDLVKFNDLAMKYGASLKLISEGISSTYLLVVNNMITDESLYLDMLKSCNGAMDINVPEDLIYDIDYQKVWNDFKQS